MHRNRCVIFKPRPRKFNARSVKDLIALAKSRPGQLTFGAASGGTPHMAGELFKLMAGIDMLFVPYKGEGPAVADALGEGGQGRGRQTPVREVTGRS
ncbi:MAG: hypothetical protein HY527_14605 [Betaproteobacteria bacterium]|nr:hypothetical protein [Betaproteobacteria bacterium]